MNSQINLAAAAPIPQSRYPSFYSLQNPFSSVAGENATAELIQAPQGITFFSRQYVLSISFSDLEIPMVYSIDDQETHFIHGNANRIHISFYVETIVLFTI